MIYHLTIILPTLNERENIIRQIEALYRAAPGIAEIIVVDDNSNDGTREAVQASYSDLIAKGKIKLIHRTKDLGLTNSLKEAVMQSTQPFVGWMDCDLSMPPELLPKLMEEIMKGADIALGSRFKKGGNQKSLIDVGQDSRAEIILSTLLNGALRLVTGAPCTDFTSGFIVVKKSWLENFNWRGSHGEYFIYLISDAHREGKKIAELPYSCGSRQYGESKTFGNWRAVVRNSLRYSGTMLNVLRAKVIRF